MTRAVKLVFSLLWASFLGALLGGLIISGLMLMEKLQSVTGIK